jgi:2,3,4,5-tetrahydropyridine-2-carboxylate N-succinyltransferase
MVTDSEALQAILAPWIAHPSPTDDPGAREAVRALLEALDTGRARAAERDASGQWHAVQWVKSGIILAFRTGLTREFVPHPGAQNSSFGGSTFQYFDRDTLPLKDVRGVEDNVRIVPGGSSVRAGVYLGPRVVVMPPAFMNIGAYVGEGSMVDSHALVGSCAQVGKNVHLSAGAQLGGVIEPIGSRPVIVEDDVLVGGNTGIFEGTLVGRRAVIAPGVQLTRSTAVYDLVREKVYRADGEVPLSIPEGAVVVPGSRPAKGDFATSLGVGLYAPVIVKYRDESTDAATALEEALR